MSICASQLTDDQSSVDPTSLAKCLLRIIDVNCTLVIFAYQAMGKSQTFPHCKNHPISVVEGNGADTTGPRLETLESVQETQNKPEELAGLLLPVELCVGKVSPCLTMQRKF